jgi:Ca2+-binding RTX toxin-like protein
MIRRLLWLALYAVVIICLASVGSSLAAGNAVPASRAGLSISAINANALKPAACASLNLTGIVVGSSSFSGSGGNDLILGGSAADTIRGGGGIDCILGGGGDDNITGNNGSVCIGGPGNDTFKNCTTTIQ